MTDKENPIVHSPSVEVMPSLPKKDIAKVLFNQNSSANEESLAEFLSETLSMFERFIQRRKNYNTQRAYRSDVLCFADFMNIPITEGIAGDIKRPSSLTQNAAWQLLMCKVDNGQAWRDYLVEQCDLCHRRSLVCDKSSPASSKVSCSFVYS